MFHDWWEDEENVEREKIDRRRGKETQSQTDYGRSGEPSKSDDKNGRTIVREGTVVIDWNLLWLANQKVMNILQLGSMRGFFGNLHKEVCAMDKVSADHGKGFRNVFSEEST